MKSSGDGLTGVKDSGRDGFVVIPKPLNYCYHLKSCKIMIVSQSSPIERMPQVTRFIR